MLRLICQTTTMTTTLWPLLSLLVLPLLLTATPTTSSAAALQQQQQPYDCPKECICLSSTQVLCNGGGLDHIPDNLPPTVEHLSLTKNRIRHLKTDAFQRYRYIRKLYLDGNAITHISAFAFRGLSRLQELSLQNTPLERIGQFTFSGLHNLTSLYLSNNHIRRIESYAFAGTSTIRLLVLTNNPTIRIDSSAFAGLSDVQMIYLPAGIRHLEQDAFNGLSLVGHLKLAHLDLNSLNSYVFRGLRHVQLLSIHESDLGTIRAGVFTNMSNIGRLSMVNNKIDAIDSLEITANNRLKQLHFIGNHLLDLPPTRSFRIQGVAEKSVSGNHFPCDCRLNSWLNSSTLFANQSHTQLLTNNFCISPYEVHGRTIQSAIDDFDLLGECSPESYNDDDIETDQVAALPEPPSTRQPSNLLGSAAAARHPAPHRVICHSLIITFILTRLYYL